MGLMVAVGNDGQVNGKEEGQGTYLLAYIRRIKVSQVGGISAYLIEEMPHLTQGKLLNSCSNQTNYRGRGLGDGSDI